MARRMAADGEFQFRVVVTCKRRRDNPEWARGDLDVGRFLWDGEEYDVVYGPYSLSGARGVLTRETVNPWGEPRPGAVRGKIQKAHTEWKDFE